MRRFELNDSTAITEAPASGQIVTTLYDLIESLNTQVVPDEDDLVVAAIS